MHVLIWNCSCTCAYIWNCVSSLTCLPKSYVCFVKPECVPVSIMLKKKIWKGCGSCWVSLKFVPSAYLSLKALQRFLSSRKRWCTSLPGNKVMASKCIWLWCTCSESGSESDIQFFFLHAMYLTDSLKKCVVRRTKFELTARTVCRKGSKTSMKSYLNWSYALLIPNILVTKIYKPWRMLQPVRKETNSACRRGKGVFL